MRSTFTFIAAHPDDIELSCAGFIQSLNKDEANFIICTKGELKAPYNEKAQQKIGVPFVNLGWQDGNIKVNGDTIKQLEGQTFGEIVFTHYPEDTHQDHIAVSKIVTSICSRPSRPSRQHLNLIYFDSSSSVNFKPNLFVPINWEAKLKWLNIFKYRMSPGVIRKAKAKAVFYGAQIGVKYAEAYCIRQGIWQLTNK